MKDKLRDKLYQLWLEVDNTNEDEHLHMQIEDCVNRDKDGAEELLDWCRCEYEKLQDKYGDDYQNNLQMYEDCDYYEALENVWDLSNWYLDYCNGDMTESELLEWVERY